MRLAHYALLLVATALAAAGGIVMRRAVGIRQQQELLRLGHERDALRAAVGEHRAAFAQATSRTDLGAIAQNRLGMRVPSDSQVLILRRQTRAPAE